MGLSEDSAGASDAAVDAQLQQQVASLKLDATAANDGDDETKEDHVPSDTAAQQQQQQFESDAALAAAMSCGCEVEDPIFLTCQICFDVLLEHETVTRLCGDACTLEVCAECLVQHLTASVYSFYPGVLPKVRCPTCLTLLNKSAWAKFVKPEEAANEVAQQASVETETAEAAGSVEHAAPAEEETQEPAPEEYVALPAIDGSDADAVAPEAGASAAAEVASESDIAASDEVAAAANPVEPQAHEPAPPVAAPPSGSAHALDFSHVLEKYEILCRQSCEFQSPCCHNPEYTMLPPFSDDAESELAAVLQPAEGKEDPLPLLKQRLELFCFHREETKAFYALLANVLAQHAAADALWHVLAMIRDEERRATLLLYHLFLHPDTYTLCCDEAVCFKCKAQTHHAGQCDDFIEDDCVLQCRGCHVTLVKVDGCDSVGCVCGHSIHWPSEMEKQRSQRKKLAPADDSEHAHWLAWKQHVQRSHAKIASLTHTLRELRLKRFIRRHRAALLEMLARYRTAKAKRKEQAASALDATDAVPGAESTAAAGPAGEQTQGEAAEGVVAQPAERQPAEVKRLGVEGELQDESAPLPAAA